MAKITKPADDDFDEDAIKAALGEGDGEDNPDEEEIQAAAGEAPALETPEQLASFLSEILSNTGHEETHLSLAHPDKHVLQTLSPSGRRMQFTIEHTPPAN
jgi:hypothetical protein